MANILKKFSLRRKTLHLQALNEDNKLIWQGWELEWNIDLERRTGKHTKLWASGVQLTWRRKIGSITVVWGEWGRRGE